MKRYTMFFCLVSCLIGCGTIGTASYEQNVVGPAYGGDCEVMKAGHLSWSGVDFAGRTPTEFANANGRMNVTAGTYLVLCRQGKMLEEAAKISYGYNSAWGNKEAAEALKLAQLADKKSNDIIKTFAENGGPAVPAPPTSEVKPQSAPSPAPANASSWFVPNLVSATSYMALITTLDTEAAANPSRTELCRSFSGLLKIEMAKDPENKNFQHAQSEVIKAFATKGN
jgi:hypothetical protein